MSNITLRNPLKHGSPICLHTFRHPGWTAPLSIPQLFLLLEFQGSRFRVDYHFPNCVRRILDPQRSSSNSVKNRVSETRCIPDASLEGLQGILVK